MKRLAFSLLMMLSAAAFAEDDVRAQLEARRDADAAEFDRQEQACASKFAVTDCINQVKARRRAVMADYRKQETALNDADRQRRAQEELQRLEQKKQEQAERAQKAASADADSEQERLRAQKQRQADHGPQGAPRSAASALRAPTNAIDPATAQKNEKAYAQRQQDAASRRAERDKRLQEKKKDKPVADLPAPK